MKATGNYILTADCSIEYTETEIIAQPALAIDILLRVSIWGWLSSHTQLLMGIP